ELARHYAKKERWTDVARVLEDAPLIDPYPTEPHFLLAEAQRRTGRPAAALFEYDQALVTKAPVPADCELGAAPCLDALGKKAQALAGGKKALEHDAELGAAKELRDRLEKELAPR